MMGILNSEWTGRIIGITVGVAAASGTAAWNASQEDNTVTMNFNFTNAAGIETTIPQEVTRGSHCEIELAPMRGVPAILECGPKGTE